MHFTSIIAEAPMSFSLTLLTHQCGPFRVKAQVLFKARMVLRWTLSYFPDLIRILRPLQSITGVMYFNPSFLTIAACHLLKPLPLFARNESHM